MNPEEMKQLLDQASKDWDIIRENPTLFLSNHKGKIGERYRSNIQISRSKALVKFLVSAVKNLSGIFVSTPDIAWSDTDSSNPSAPLTHAVITLAGDKYHYDAERIQEGIKSHGKHCTLILIGSKTGEALLPKFSHRIRAARTYLERTYQLGRQASDSGRRLLLASHTLNAVRTECLIHVAFSHQHRIKNLEKVISIVPFNQISRSLTGACDTLGIETYALRTQTVNYSPSHLAINTKYLFYRTEHEQKVYASLKPFLNCELIPGGIYNLPPKIKNETSLLDSMKEYVLVLGTAPANNETFEQWRDQIVKIIYIASSFKDKVIYKSHNMALNWDTQIIPKQCPGVIHIKEIRENKLLIDNAEMVISFPSTLLFYTMQKNIPILLLTNIIHTSELFKSIKMSEHDISKEYTPISFENIKIKSKKIEDNFNYYFRPEINENTMLNTLSRLP